MRQRAISRGTLAAAMLLWAAWGPILGQDETKPGAEERKPMRVDSGPRVWMSLSGAEVTVGETVTIAVEIDGLGDVGHVPFQVTFDPAVLQFTSGDEGNFLNGDGKQTAFFAAPTSSGDTVVIGLSRLGRIKGVGGAGRLCELHFVAVGSGPARLAFVKAKVRNSANEIVEARFQPAPLSVR